MKKKKIKEKKQTTEMDAVSKTLSSIYTGVFLIDLIRDTYSAIKVTESVGAVLKGITSAQQAISSAIKKTVFEDEILDMLMFVNLTTLSARMGREKILSTEYRGVISGWVRGSFMEVQRNQEGALIQVLYVYQVIDDNKRKELEHLQELKDNYAISEKENKESRKKTAKLEADKKELTDDLKYHNSFTRIVMEQLNCGVMVYTIPGRNLLEINREALRIFGWKNKEEAAEKFIRNWENNCC